MSANASVCDSARNAAACRSVCEAEQLGVFTTPWEPLCDDYKHLRMVHSG